VFVNLSAEKSGHTIRYSFEARKTIRLVAMRDRRATRHRDVIGSIASGVPRRISGMSQLASPALSDRKGGEGGPLSFVPVPLHMKTVVPDFPTPFFRSIPQSPLPHHGCVRVLSHFSFLIYFRLLLPLSSLRHITDFFCSPQVLLPPCVMAGAFSCPSTYGSSYMRAYTHHLLVVALKCI
jgi:hypothetical protein